MSAKVLASLLSRPRGATELVLWFVFVLGGSTAVLFACQRVARRALPLATLLKMTLAFPDRAPTRLAVARRAGSTKSLERRLAEAQQKGIRDELSVAAEKILALAAALNVHDRRTRGHSERVRAYADLIAEQMNLPQADRDRLRWSALLHDVGKLTVHPEILNKGGKPSPEEWEVLKRHPLEGAKITQPLAGWLGPWALTIAEHHERFDGQGYPHGLAREQISLGGRIVAVADSYEVMTAVRSYKSAMSAQAARRELAACAGGQFDPEVVRALLEASLGRMRLAAGFLAWLGQLPLVNGFSNVAQLGSIAGRSAMASFAAAGSVVTGVASAPSSQAPAGLAVIHPGSGSSSTAGSAAQRSGPPPAPATPGAAMVVGGTTTTVVPPPVTTAAETDKAGTEARPSAPSASSPPDSTGSYASIPAPTAPPSAPSVMPSGGSTPPSRPPWAGGTPGGPSTSASPPPWAGGPSGGSTTPPSTRPSGGSTSAGSSTPPSPPTPPGGSTPSPPTPPGRSSGGSPPAPPGK